MKNEYSEKILGRVFNAYGEPIDGKQVDTVQRKNINSKRIWALSQMKYLGEADKYEITFMPDKNKISRQDGWIKSDIKIGIVPDDSIEIREIELKNTGGVDEILEVTPKSLRIRKRILNNQLRAKARANK